MIHIGSGIGPEKLIENSLLNCRKTGMEVMKKFVDNRLDSESIERLSFYDTLKKSDLKTFTDIKKKITIKTADGTMSKENILP